MKRLCALLLAGVLAACSTPQGAGQGKVAVWSSSFDGSRKLAPQPALELSDAAAADAIAIWIDPSTQRQEIVGYGAAMTDASAFLLQSVMKRPERDVLLAELFGRDGLALNFLRVPIGASDFSMRHYSLDDMPGGQADPDLAHFSLDPAREQIAAVKAARTANPGLVMMASPWSAPGWMKTSDSMIDGALRPDRYDAFARYFVRYLDAMEGEGLSIAYVSAQNEPQFSPADYPGMKLEAPARARFIADHLGPALAARKSRVGILDWDHNWDQANEPLAVLADPGANRYVTGVAWHCYAGDPSVMERVRAAHPDKEVFFSECSGGEWEPDWGDAMGWMIDNLIIAPTRGGSKGTLMWNLALDEKFGPHLGGCGDCRGVVTINSRTGAVTRNVEYYVLGHLSRFLRPGARALESSGGPQGVTHAAFRNSDGSLVLLAHNPGKQDKELTVSTGKRAFRLAIPAGEVMTMAWRQ